MRPSPPLSTSEQEFPYGWRYVKRTLPDGGVEFDQVPLTLEDALHPLEGDVIPESKPHEADRRYLTSVFESCDLSPAYGLVTSDLIVRWGVEGMRDHAPDVAIFTGMRRDPESIDGSLDLMSYGGTCQLVVELVSPSTRDNDVVWKFQHYHQLGIAWYIVIDQPIAGGPRFLRPYKRKESRYAEVETDDRERVAVPFLGLMIGLRDNRVICYDLRTEEVLGNYAGIARERREDKRKLEAAALHSEQREQAIEELVEVCHKTERRAKEAESLADQQRKEADKQRQEADKQRQEADRAQKEAEKERRAREEADKAKQFAQEQADQRIRDLEELVRRLQGTSAGG